MKYLFLSIMLFSACSLNTRFSTLRPEDFVRTEKKIISPKKKLYILGFRFVPVKESFEASFYGMLPGFSGIEAYHDASADETAETQIPKSEPKTMSEAISEGMRRASQDSILVNSIVREAMWDIERNSEKYGVLVSSGSSHLYDPYYRKSDPVFDYSVSFKVKQVIHSYKMHTYYIFPFTGLVWIFSSSPMQEIYHRAVLEMTVKDRDGKTVKIKELNIPSYESLHFWKFNWLKTVDDRTLIVNNTVEEIISALNEL